MVKRIKLGIIFGYSETHIAVTYYILNIIKGLNILNDSEKPHITIFCKNEIEYKKIQNTGYPYLSESRIVYDKGVNNFVNVITKIFFKKTYLGFAYDSDEIDVLFPGSDMSCFRHLKNKIYWAGDFQDLYYKQYFSWRVLLQRRIYRNRISYNSSNIVLSSYDNLNQYNTHFPKNNATKFVYQFTVVNPILEEHSFDCLISKYDLNREYFIIPNQFWRHKNHHILIKAAKLLKKRNVNFQFVLTGKEDDGKGGSYVAFLKELVISNELKDHIKFLGFIPRLDLLKLIKHSMALIQPSFYEGWNTSIEDAKSLNKMVIASKLDVHQEQLGKTGLYFDPFDTINFANVVESFLLEKTGTNYLEYNYEIKIKKQAVKFVKIINHTLLNE